MTKYDLSAIMKKAWTIYKAGKVETFGEALHRAWASAKAKPINAERIEAAKAAAGITEEVMTWSEWKKAGYEVRHGSKMLFQVSLIWASKGDGAEYKASFFGRSQVEELVAA